MREAPTYGHLYWYTLSPRNEFYDNLPFYIKQKIWSRPTLTGHFTVTYKIEGAITLKLSIECKKVFSVNDKVNS